MKILIKKISFIVNSTLFVCCTLLVACGGSNPGNGEVGKQKDVPPEAKIEVLGVSSQLTDITTRSGTDVILSGQNSNGIDDPILKYEWKQIDNSGYPIVFYERTNNTVAFATPQLPADLAAGVTLIVELTITDADGVKASNKTSIKVLPVADPNRYLVNPHISEAVRIYIAGVPGSILNANTAATITVKPFYSWRDRTGNLRELALTEKNYNTNLTSGRVADVLDSATAFVTIPMPDLDLDEINQHFQGAARAGRLEIENLGTVQIEWQLSLQATSGQTINAYLVNPATTQFISPDNVLVSGGTPSVQNILLNNGSLASVRMSIEKLRQSLALESKLSAENYHRCIDPLNKSTNFNDWLEQAGFNSANANDIHTKYINNYDLGFGRDMHIRTDQNGNVYSYVANYNNLENTISNRNAFAIVVMEYSPAPIGNCGDGIFTDPVNGKKVVKFYTFVPDEVNGGFRRALSMNFDGRGEKYLPGSCTACHGGKTNADVFNSTVAIDAVAADLDAGFMPWDLDAFLYTHANDAKLIDPAYASFAKTTPPTASITEKFSREKQEVLFKQQNQASLHTYTQDIHKLKRYETAIKLIRGWYSNSAELAEMEALDFGTDDNPLTDEQLIALQAKLETLPAGNYNGNFVLQGWRQDATVESLYNQVFDRHCRLCHVQMNKPQIDFNSYHEFISNPWLIDYVYAQGAMPMSRLTMDRFWNHFQGETSAADLLRQHLNLTQNANLSANTIPGLPQARIAEEANPELIADVFLNFDQQLVLDASGSFLSDTFTWKINSNVVSQTPVLSMNAGAPGIEYTASLQTHRNGYTSSPVVRRIKVNNYTPQFPSQINATVNEGGIVQIDLLNSICADVADSLQCRIYFGDIIAGQRPTIELDQTTIRGQIAWINQPLGVVSFRSTSPAAAGAGQFTFKLVDSFGEKSANITVAISVNALSAPQIGADDFCQVVAITSANTNSFPVSFGTLVCPNPLLNDTAASGLSLSLQSVTPASQRGGSVSVVNGVIHYTPPKFFVGTDSFSYTVVDNSLSQRTATGSVTVTVSPGMTYTNLHSRFTANCAVVGCHRPAQNGSGPNWTNYATLIQPLGDTVGITNGNLNLTTNTSIAQILNTKLFIYACTNEGDHTGGNRLCTSDMHEMAPTTRSQLNQTGRDILQWIEEGARNN